MSLIILNVDEVRRTLSASGGAFVTHDKEVDIVRFAINSGFADIVLDGQVALRVMYQRPGETEVRAQTLTYYDTDGLRNYYDWQLLSADLAKKGTLTVALCILDISGGEVSEWHTTPCAVRVLSTIHTDDSDEGDETITPTVAQRVAVLETMIQRVASGAPIVVASTSAMTDTDQIYVLSTDGMWYYYDGTAWVAGGEYGGVAAGSITTDKLANKSVTTAKIDDSAVTWQKLASGAVHTGELADSAVTNVKLADSSVSERKLASGAVTTAKIADGAITADKLSSDIDFNVETDTTLTQSGIPADAEAVGGKIAEVNERLVRQQQDFNSIVVIPANLYNTDTYVEGYYIDDKTGEAKAYTNWGYFVANVTGGEEYYLVGVPIADPTTYEVIGDLYIGYFDGETFVSGQRILSKASNKTIVIPANANIAKISAHSYELRDAVKGHKDIMLVTTAYYNANVKTPSDYVEYTDKTTIKKSVLPDDIMYKSDSEGIVYAKNALVISVDEATKTSNGGQWASLSVQYTLSDLGLKAGDHIIVTIGEQEGCLDNTIFSLEAYNGSTKLRQAYATKVSMMADMVIPSGTDILYFVYRLCTTTVSVKGNTATWRNVKLYYEVIADGKKVIFPEYCLANAVTSADLSELKTGVEKSTLFDTNIYGNVNTAIENSMTAIGRKKFLMLAWFSDLHRNPFSGTAADPVETTDDVFYSTVELMKYLAKKLPLHATLDTGDIIKGSQPYLSFDASVNFRIEAEYIRSFYEASYRYLYTPGNHDGYNANSVNLQDIDYPMGVSMINRDIESKQPGKCYYYVDFPEIKTRLLVLAIPGGGSALGLDSTQLQWIANTGLGDVPDNYGVLLAYHIPTICISYLENGDGGFGNRISFEGLINAFHNHTTYSDSVVSADFSGKVGTKIIAALNGHMHFDAVSNPGEVFTQDKGREGTAKAGESLTNNLPCKQIIIDGAYKGVVDIMIYVPDDGKIYLKRIGAGSDREVVVN